MCMNEEGGYVLQDVITLFSRAKRLHQRIGSIMLTYSGNPRRSQRYLCLIKGFPLGNKKCRLTIMSLTRLFDVLES